MCRFNKKGPPSCLPLAQVAKSCAQLPCRTSQECGKSIMQDKKTDPFYKSGPWRAVRQQALDRDLGICQECLRRFYAGQVIKVQNAVMVHHIKPREERPDLELDLNNLESLCDKHHNYFHPEKGHKPKNDKPSAPRARIIKL